MKMVARMSRLPTQTPRPNSYRQERLCIMISYVLKNLAAIQNVYLLKPNVLYVQLITLCEHSAVAQIELIILFCGWNIK